jgi:lipopolysaccharide/colanic/teichoic acid biosynthesis glycosyltransferase
MTSARVSKQDRARRAIVRAPRRFRRPSPLAGRMLDLTVATVALILLSPFLALTALVLALENDGPVIFRHRRVGKDGQCFEVLKFRSMHVDADRILAKHLRENPAAAAEWARDQKLKHDPRITPLGRFLRRSSLDELPQLVNVLVGDMSVVGPRPIVEAEIVRYGRCFRHYCRVRPGITGIWQVSGRNDVSYRRRVAMDALYARRKCATLDLRLMLATIPAVLSRKGSY